MGYHNKQLLHFPAQVWWIVTASLLVKMLLIQWNTGEYTDGIIQLTLWNSPVVFFPPGYSAVVGILQGLTGNALIAGRLVSILASVASLLIFYKLMGHVTSRPSIAVTAVLFLALSPIYNRWSIRVMTDSLFLMMFLINGLECMVLFKNEKRSPLYLLGWCGAASLVRYQGLVFLPFVLFFWIKRHSRYTKMRRSGGLSGFGLVLIPWLLLILWMSMRGFGHAGQFIERASYGFWTTLSLYYNMFETFVLYWPWAVTYSLFLLALIGIFHSLKGTPSQIVFMGFTLLLSILFLVVQSAFLSFQYRYLLPLVPFWCGLAALGWERVCAKVKDTWIEKTLFTGVMINLVVMSSAVLLLQRGTFGDVADSARFLHTPKFHRVVKGNYRILSDEIYRQGVYNVKMRFWSKNTCDILYYPLTPPRAGDVLILHNAYSDLSSEKERLEKTFKLAVLHSWTSHHLGGRYVTLPLLPDVMVNPRTPPLTSNPPCMGFRFAPQYYYSVALLLQEKPG